VKRLFKFITQHSIAAKLAAMAVASAFFMLFVALTVLFIGRNELANERTERAHAIVDAVWSMADTFKRAADSGAMTEAEAKARFYAASGAVWFEGHSNYIFIYDTKPDSAS
jgi:methyl-accepting chemotaxis protein